MIGTWRRDTGLWLLVQSGRGDVCLKGLMIGQSRRDVGFLFVPQFGEKPAGRDADFVDGPAGRLTFFEQALDLLVLGGIELIEDIRRQAGIVGVKCHASSSCLQSRASVAWLVNKRLRSVLIPACIK